MPNNTQNQITQLERSLKQLQDRYSKLEKDLQKHQHDGIDGTNVLRKSITLDKDQYLQVGYAGMGSSLKTGQYQYGMSIGQDDQRTGFVNKANLAEVDILYTPTSFGALIGRYGIVVTAMENTALSISAAGNTVTISGYNFTTNELAGAIINIYNSSGTMIANNLISSNTSTVITVTGTWGATASDCTFDIYKPLYSGAAQYVWQRYYTQEGTDGGVRFGMGVTAGGKNGLLYMDSVGDIYWRNKAGVAAKLSLPAGITDVIQILDGDTVTTHTLTFTDGILTAYTT